MAAEPYAQTFGILKSGFMPSYWTDTKFPPIRIFNAGTALQTQIAEARMFIRPPAQRPVKE